MTVGPKVLVAGAGALGLCVALTLAERGARVTVDDPAAPGDNASGVAAGMLAPVFEAALDPVATPHFDLLMSARDLWPAFAARIGVALDRSGAVAVGEASWVSDVEARISTLGVSVGRLHGGDLEMAAPGLAPGSRLGLVCVEDWRLSPSAALSALRRAADHQGVVFRRQAVSDARGFDRLVVATGASRALVGLAPELAGLAPIKGHILRLPVTKPRVTRGPGVYLVPIAEGIAVGATMEAGRDDRSIDPDQARRLLDAATRLFPGLAGAPAAAAAGVRAATPDGLPLAGPSVTPGVLVAVGARRNGWLLAPLIAEVACAHVLQDDPGPFADALAPRRFSPG